MSSTSTTKSATENGGSATTSRESRLENNERSVLGYKESFKQWIWPPSQTEAEDGILNLVSGIPSDRLVNHSHTEISISPSIVGASKSSTCGEKSYFINEYSITSPSSSSSSDNGNKTLVMMHGYGAGLAFFFKNFGALATGLGPRWNIYALDWLGYGGSSRPKFNMKTTDLSKTQEITLPTAFDSNKTLSFKENVAVRETEDWFVESLEAWRKAKNIDKFTLMGHSMGGYLAAVYAFRYPERVEKLVMVSPAGVERGYDPKLDDERSFKKAFFGNGSSGTSSTNSGNEHEPELNDEVNMPQTEIQHADHDTHHHNHNNQKINKQQQQQKLKEEEPEMETTEFGTRPKGWRSAENRRTRFRPKIAYLWNNHYSPFFLIRSSFVFGPRLVSYWSYNRFNGLSVAERDAMHLYAYKIMTAKGSGEYAITRLLAPGALPRMPLLDRLDTPYGLLRCPSLWIYGQQDWMDVEAGAEAVETLNKVNNSLAKLGKSSIINSADRVDRSAQYIEVPQAGHHLYLDNPSFFNRALIRYLTKA